MSRHHACCLRGSGVLLDSRLPGKAVGLTRSLSMAPREGAVAGGLQVVSKLILLVSVTVLASLSRQTQGLSLSHLVGGSQATPSSISGSQQINIQSDARTATYQSNGGRGMLGSGNGMLRRSLAGFLFNRVVTTTPLGRAELVPPHIQDLLLPTQLRAAPTTAAAVDTPSVAVDGALVNGKHVKDWTVERTMFQALHMAVAEEMDSDPTVCVIGEDVGHYGGSYKVTSGLHYR
eukprot:GHVN01060414.1.p1 GENE.GHVN01060414.1~~GHVN01060414.1.p1  ORF type:complete len:233 (-),score=22.71 GHVN01060414.1:92-790(-)